MKILIWSLIVLASGTTPSRADDAKGHHHHASSVLDADRPPAVNGESLYNATSPWTNQDGKQVKLDSLRGRPVVIAMIYTGCTGACPMTIADLKKIENKLSSATRAQVRFGIFSFDSDRDTPAKLAEFAKSRGIDLQRWTLFHGKTGSVRELTALLGIQYKKIPGGDFDHSNVITALDSSGVIRAQQVGLGKDPKEIVAELEKLSTK